MLDRNAVEYGINVANNATSNGLVLDLIPDSPIDLVYKAHGSLSTDHYKQAMEDGTTVQAIIESSADSVYNLHSHSGEVDNVATAVANVLERKMSGVKNEVFPLVREISKIVNETRTKIEHDNPLNVTVELITPPTIFSMSYLENALESYSDRVPSSSTLGDGLRMRLVNGVTDAEVIEMLSTTSESFNKEIALVIAGEYDGSSNETMDEGVGGNYITDKHVVSGIELYQNTNAVRAFLFIKAVNANKHPYIKTEDLSSEERMALSRAQAYYAGKTIQHIRLLNKDEGSSRVFFTIKSNRRVVVARSKQYMQWVEGEGSLEAVIGCVADNGNISTLETDVRNNPAKWEENFKRRQRVHEGSIRQMTNNEIEAVTSREIIRHYVSIAKQAPELEALSQDKIKEAREYFKNNRMHTGMDQEKFVSQAVCRTIGSNYDAELIYTEMCNYLEDPANSEATMNDAGYVAYAILVGRFLGRQVTSQKVSSSFAPALKTR